MYLELVYNGHDEVARSFLDRLKGTQEECYQDDIHKLSLVTNREHMAGYQIMDNFRCVCVLGEGGSEGREEGGGMIKEDRGD